MSERVQLVDVPVGIRDRSRGVGHAKRDRVGYVRARMWNVDDHRRIATPYSPQEHQKFCFRTTPPRMTAAHMLPPIQRGPEPQKWSSEGLLGQPGRQDVIVRFALTDQEAKLSLDQLARRHPVPLK